MKLSKEDKKQLLELSKSKNIYLEGNIIKLIEGDDTEFEQYLKDAAEKDRESRRKRLEITKKIQAQNSELSKLNEQNSKMMQDLEQTLKNVEESKEQIESQNNELLQWREENEKMQEELKQAVKISEDARREAERAKENAESDLDIMQKKTQFELIGTIVKVSLFVILGVGVGQQLVVGAIDPKQVLRILGPRQTQIHLVSEIQEVYRMQGVSIHDKHIEIIVRQMLKRITVLEPETLD